MNQEKISGWGSYPSILSNCHTPNNQDTLLKDLTQLKDQFCIPRGSGRSYGDCALSPNIIYSERFNTILAFDSNNGIIKCESGITLARLLEIIVPKTWLLGVLPGTQFITLGGAIASDIHGKNHHRVGSFSEFVLSFDLLTSDGQIITCSRTENPELFYASCGGLGLTGFILNATLQLVKINSSQIEQNTLKARSLQESIDLILEHTDAPYSVSWLDCTASGKNLGRSLLLTGKLSQEKSNLSFSQTKALRIPPKLIRPWLQANTIKCFNYFYYYWPRKKENIFSLNQYFFPLDQFQNWNLWYGKNGFTQYQFVIPVENTKVLKEILLKAQNFKMHSYLSILKILGAANKNYLSFAQAGLTVTLDFKISSDLWAFLDELDQIIIAAGGRIYLTKDCRIHAKNFRLMYPEWQKFLDIKHKYDPKNLFQSLQSQRLELF